MDANQLGFQPSGRSFGGQGGGLHAMLLKMMLAKAPPQGQPNAQQLTALNAGAGPVNADYAAKLAQGPAAAGAVTNPYYHVGLGTSFY